MLRLQTRPQFQAVLAGKTIARTRHFALHVAELTGDASQREPAPSVEALGTLFPVRGIWLGAMVPKRWAKRAVTRNAIKRQIYAVSATYQSSLEPCVHLVRLRSAFDRTQFISACSDQLKQAVRNELLQLFDAAVSPERKR